MTQTTEEEALALWDEVKEKNRLLPDFHIAVEALRRAIDERKAIQKEHDDYKQKVSDALMQAFPNTGLMPDCLVRIIIPAPKPDPLLVEVLTVLGVENAPEDVESFRAALEARGLKIVEVKNDE